MSEQVVPAPLVADNGLTLCGHRSRSEGCKVPDGEHEWGEGNSFERDGHERCPCCKLAFCDEPGLKDRHATYEESGTCLPCAMAQDGLTIEDVAAIFNRRD